MESKGRKRFKCPLCPSLDMGRPELEGHIATRHLSYMPYECTHCNFVKLPTEYYFFEHVEKQHKGLEVKGIFTPAKESQAKLDDLMRMAGCRTKNDSSSASDGSGDSPSSSISDQGSRDSGAVSAIKQEVILCTEEGGDEEKPPIIPLLNPQSSSSHERDTAEHPPEKREMGGEQMAGFGLDAEEDEEDMEESSPWNIAERVLVETTALSAGLEEEEEDVRLHPDADQTHTPPPVVVRKRGRPRKRPGGAHLVVSLPGKQKEGGRKRVSLEDIEDEPSASSASPLPLEIPKRKKRKNLSQMVAQIRSNRAAEMRAKRIVTCTKCHKTLSSNLTIACAHTLCVHLGVDVLQCAYCTHSNRGNIHSMRTHIARHHGDVQMRIISRVDEYEDEVKSLHEECFPTAPQWTLKRSGLQWSRAVFRGPWQEAEAGADTSKTSSSMEEEEPENPNEFESGEGEETESGVKKEEQWEDTPSESQEATPTLSERRVCVKGSGGKEHVECRCCGGLVQAVYPRFRLEHVYRAHLKERLLSCLHCSYNNEGAIYELKRHTKRRHPHKTPKFTDDRLKFMKKTEQLAEECFPGFPKLGEGMFVGYPEDGQGSWFGRRSSTQNHQNLRRPQAPIGEGTASITPPCVQDSGLMEGEGGKGAESSGKGGVWEGEEEPPDSSTKKEGEVSSEGRKGSRGRKGYKKKKFGWIEGVL